MGGFWCAGEGSRGEGSRAGEEVRSRSTNVMGAGGGGNGSVGGGELGAVYMDGASLREMMEDGAAPGGKP